MKIIFDPKLKKLAERLGKALGTGLPGTGRENPAPTRNDDNEETLFVGRGQANKALKRKKNYPKCWEVGKATDNIDYLRKIILNQRTVEKDEFPGSHRKSPEKILFQKFDYDCGGGIFCTALIMVGREDVLKTDVYSRLEVNPVDGTKSMNMKKLCEEEQIEYLEFWGASLDDVENVLNNNGVVITSYQSEGTEEEVKKLECGHYSLIFDIDAESVWLIDPSWDEEYIPGFGNGVVRRPREEFEKLWIDKGIDGTIYNRWMLSMRIKDNLLR